MIHIEVNELKRIQNVKKSEIVLNAILFISHHIIARNIYLNFNKYLAYNMHHIRSH